MPGWGQDTPWRQGQILSAQTTARLAAQLGIGDAAESIILVISHDCDLAHTDLAAEPHCEIIVGKAVEIDKIQGSYTQAKHQRRLHLSFTHGERKIAGDFFASQKFFIKKGDLEGDDPDSSARLSPDDLSALQRWLTIRYRRTSFPTEFNNRIRPIENRLAKIMDRTGDSLTGMYFLVDRNQDVERDGKDDPYALRIVLVENSQQDPTQTAKAFAESRFQILQLFKGQFKRGEKWENIELEGVEPSSDEKMTLRQSWRLREWKL